jgi:hypothetical protein
LDEKNGSIIYDNPVFSDDLSVKGKLENGIIITTRLEENGYDDNEGFEKLSGKGNKIGLMIFKIREFFINVIRKQKTFASYAWKILLLIGFIIYFGFAMSVKYGTSAFPIKGNVFSRNSGIDKSIQNHS